MPALETLVLLAALAAGSDTVLLDFTSQYCGPCKTMEPVVRRLQQDGFPLRQVDIDRERDLATHFRVTGVPCFVLVSGGKEVDRIVGPASYDRLAQMFAKARPTTTQTESKQVRGQSPDGGPRGGNPELLDRLAEREVTRGQNRSFDYTRLAERTDKNPSAEGNGASHHERALAATVRLKIDEAKSLSYGTGTIIDTHGDEALVLTCGHIFRDSAGKGTIPVETCGSPAKAVAGHLIAYDLKRDVALVSIRTEGAATAMQVAPAGYKPQRGAAVFSVGCDHGKEARLVESRISCIDRYVGPANLEVSGAPAEGRSGGGLFSAEGYLIGVCNAADPADNEGIYAALPSIHWQLAQIGQSGIFERAELAAARKTAAAPLLDEVASRRDAEPPPRMEDQMPAARENATRPAAASDDTEVIFIVRSKKNPAAPGETFLLDRPSAEFLNRLSQEYQESSARGRQAVAEAPIRPATRNSVRAQSADR